MALWPKAPLQILSQPNQVYLDSRQKPSDKSKTLEDFLKEYLVPKLGNLVIPVRH